MRGWKEAVVRKYVSLSLLAVLLPVLGYFYCVRGVRVGKPPSPLESRYKSEEQWLVEQIVRDIAETLAYCKHKDAPRARSVEVEVETAAEGIAQVRVSMPGAPPFQEVITLRTSVWSPEDYAPFAARLVQALGVEAEPTPDRNQEALLASLLEVRGTVLQETNAVLSADLAAHPSDPRLHEEAALLLGVLGLREAAGDFGDTRFELCRSAAHLALASAFRAKEPLSLAGHYAYAALSALAGRGADAEATLAYIQPMAAGHESFAAWSRALRMRTTHDWRILGSTSGATILESLERLRAVDASLGTGGWDPDELPPAAREIPDFGLVALVTPTVEHGNRFLGQTLLLVLSEAERVWSLTHGRALPPQDRIRVLNEPQERLVTPQGPQVIAWGTWAAFYQRHVCDLLRMADQHQRKMLALRDEADASAKRADQSFGELGLYPFVRAWRDVEAERKIKHLDEAVTVIVRRPELVTAALWAGLQSATRDEVVRRGQPEWRDWAPLGCPRGTSFDFPNRGAGAATGATLVERLEQLKEASPHEFRLISAYLDARYGKKLKAADVVREMGPLLEYDLAAIGRWEDKTYKRDDAAYRLASERRCALSADNCLGLGLYLAESGDDPGAAEAYDRAIDHARDRVGVSNRCEWVMLYHLQQGHLERARAIAKMAGEVYSGGGLQTMSRFLEETGDYAGAEEWLKREWERYGHDGEPRGELLAFYHRMAHVRGRHEYEARFEREARALFPDGLEALDESSLAGQPRDGVQILKPGGFLSHGLSGGEILVGVDGYRVRTREQIWALLLFGTDRDTVSFTVWKHPGYVEITHRSPSRWPRGTETRTYAPQG
jgi:hypothetical protein